MRCAIFYGDGSVYEGDGLDAPPTGVQVIIYDDPSIPVHNNGRIILKGWDYYVLEGSWIGINGVADFIDHVLHCKPEKVLKGRMIPRDKFQEVMQKATDYPGFKPRCGFNRGFEG